MWHLDRCGRGRSPEPLAQPAVTFLTDLCTYRKRKWLLHSLSLSGDARAFDQWEGEPKTRLLPPPCRGCVLSWGKRLLWAALIQEQCHVDMKHQPLLCSWEHKPRLPWPHAPHTWDRALGLWVRRLFCSSPKGPGPLLCLGRCCPLLPLVAARGDVPQHSLPFSDFP